MKRSNFTFGLPQGRIFWPTLILDYIKKGQGWGTSTWIQEQHQCQEGYAKETKNKKIHTNVYSKTVQKYLIWRLDVTLDGMISKITITFHEALLLLKYTKKKKQVRKEMITKGEMCYFQKTGLRKKI